MKGVPRFNYRIIWGHSKDELAPAKYSMRFQQKVEGIKSKNGCRLTAYTPKTLKQNLLGTGVIHGGRYCHS